MRSLTCVVTQIATFGAFAYPGVRSTGCRIARRGGAIMNIKTLDRRGAARFGLAGADRGAAGAGLPWGDGPEGSGANSSFLRNTPIEINESEVPVRFSRYGLADGYRGGREVAWRVGPRSWNSRYLRRRPSSRPVTAIERHLPAGVSRAAGPVRPRSSTAPDEEVLGNRDVVPCSPGDVIRIVGAGAGGWGDPLDRPPELVVFDVACGYISVEQAFDDYGVVLTDGTPRSARDGERADPAASAWTRFSTMDRVA